MEIKITIPRAQLGDLIPSSQTVAEAAGRAVFNLIKGHLAERNNKTSRRAGWPKSNYWGEAAQSVEEPVITESSASISIAKEGVALHYYGGTVRPNKAKALAIPISPLVADIWPSEKGKLSIIKDKKRNRAYLADPTTKEFLYLLVPSVTLHADPTVLPEDSAITDAATREIERTFFK